MFASTSGGATATAAPSSIQKAKNKRTILPKSSLIQLYLNTNVDKTASPNRTRLLPKFNQQDIINHLVDNPLSINKPVNKIVKDVINGGRRISNPSDANSGTELDQEGKKSGCEEARSSREGFIQHLVKDFLLDCKQKLDSESYRKILLILSEANKVALKLNWVDGDKEHKRVLDSVYEIIRLNRVLCLKFAAFLTPENAHRYDLFPQSLQYQRCYDFMSRLDQTVVNKCALKKLLHMMANASSAVAEEDALKKSTKLDEIRAKLKTVTRNNQSIINDFEGLFDQRLVIDEPVFEVVSLVDVDKPEPVVVNGRVVEYIDLTEPAVVSSASTSVANSGRNRGGRVVKSTGVGTGPTTSSNSGAVTVANKKEAKSSSKKT